MSDRAEPAVRVGTLLALLSLAVAGGEAGAAQEKDTLPAPQRPDTVAPPVQAADTAAQEDTLAAPTFPLFPDPVSTAPGLARSWEHGDLLANGALSFADLVEFRPPFDPFRAGFLEGPQAAVFAGSGPGGFSYEQDGYRIAPLNGGPLDLHLIPLVELERVRLARVPGGYRAVVATYRNPRRAPYSRIEAGTGDRDTNLLRAFLSSGIGRTRVGFGFDRIDTAGQPGLGGSARNALWASLARELMWGTWVQAEVRNISSERDSFPSPKRTDWVLRLRRPLGAGWHADLVAGYASVESGPSEEFVGDPDLPTRRSSATQVALRGARVTDHWRAQLVLRAWDGRDVPELEPEAAVEVRAGPASLYASGRYADWGRLETFAGYTALRLRLPLGLRFLAELEEGDDGLFAGEPRRWYEYSRWTAGGELEIWGWRVGGRGGRWRVHPSPALGAPLDTATSLPGRTVNVADAWARGPLFRLFGGQMAAGGFYRGRDAGAFFYWPQEEWRVEGRYHVRALNDQLDVWIIATGGVRGSMFVPGSDADPGDPSLGVVQTEDLTWFRGDAIVRIKDVHIFYNYEFFDAPSGPQDAPGFVLPRARTHFGVKWEFWN